MGNIWPNMSILLVLLLLRFHVLRFFMFLFFELFFKVILRTNLATFSQIWDYNCKTVFHKLQFLFSILSSILSRNMCKLRPKLRNTRIYPLEVRILLKCFWCHFMDNIGNFSTYMSPHYQHSFFSSKLEFLFSVLGSMVSRNMCKLRHKLKNFKNSRTHLIIIK